MIPSEMSRPADLPDYEKPPINEVVIGVQFQRLPLTGADIGVYWTEFREELPKVSEHPALAPRVENFAAPAVPELAFTFGGPAPRYWFTTLDGAELLQLQPDRLLFNWRRISPDQSYPHFEAIQKKFKEHLSRWQSFLATRDLVAHLGQWEVTYVNRIRSVERPLLVDEVMSFLAPQLRVGLAGPAEMTQLATQRVLLDDNGEPWARGYVSAQNGLESDGAAAVIFELTARGPLRPDADDATLETAQLKAREWIVRAFDNLTAPSMHKVWGKK